ncbi:dihydrofolate reductase [Mucilaginibacter robiniae]|uniref:Dihydrofolate reductase n=1 Tax=Mucilaginibacter robiniae TaxID=2728022 RepID=A0A7L5E0M5_9SPHI|nr:dihydrofolate reductase [Mucilaginibacter robiniae]QJD94373.1 dihydrofolate reductase [Mucilaginibacter robiniae]
MKNLNIIVAIATNNGIGKNNQLLWHLPADLKHFKQITSGHTVIMGRKTYDSIGKQLPNRRNIVITRRPLNIEGCEVVNSVEDALNSCNADENIFVIGGAEIYQQTLPVVNTLYLTLVHQAFEADTYFPEINKDEWLEISHEDYQPDVKNEFSYSFITLRRR